MDRGDFAFQVGERGSGIPIFFPLGVSFKPTGKTGRVSRAERAEGAEQRVRGTREVPGILTLDGETDGLHQTGRVRLKERDHAPQ